MFINTVQCNLLARTVPLPFLGNGLGGTEALVDGSGNAIATHKYDVYGAVRASGGGGNSDTNCIC